MPAGAVAGCDGLHCGHAYSPVTGSAGGDDGIAYNGGRFAEADLDDGSPGARKHVLSSARHRLAIR